MSAVISVFAVWFGLLTVLGLAAIMLAPRVHPMRWMREFGARVTTGADGMTGAFGRIAIGLFVWLAAWSVVIIIGWALGLLAHKLQNGVDWPTFRWFQRHQLTGDWARAWHQLTKIGSPPVVQTASIVAIIVLPGLYLRRAFWWLPSVTIVLAYLAEFHAQIILKDVVHRGHPPTTLGTWPSGGMARIMTIYGLIIFFVIVRFWPKMPRVWAGGAFLLVMLASIQAYARIYNLEHWVTDVVGGFLFGALMLATMILGYWVITGRIRPSGSPVAQPAVQRVGTTDALDASRP